MLVGEPLEFLKRFFTPRTVFMEIGAGDCALALSAASYVERVYAVEVGEFPGRARLPGNLRLLPAEGIAQESVDIAYSARPALRGTAQLARIYRSLAPGGTFICAAREYAPRALREVFLQAGFRSVRLYGAVGGRFVRLPFVAEKLLRNVRIAAIK
jgi:hypothetical protein